MKMNPNSAIQTLLEGNQRFAKGENRFPNATIERRKQLLPKQKPFAAVLTCSDSRIAPELIFDVGLGDIFVVRLAGNIASTEAIGSLQYAALHLDVQLIVVMGHQNCGAIKAAIANEHITGEIGAILREIRSCVDQAKWLDGDLLDNSAKINVADNVRKIKEHGSEFRNLVSQDKLKIAGMYYSIESGLVEVLPDLD